MLYLKKYLTNFQKLSFGKKDVEGGYCGWQFQVQRHFALGIATLPLFQHPENVQISIFPFRLHTRNAESSKVFHELSKTFFFLKHEEGGYCGWKFQVYRHFTFSVATLSLFQHPENVKMSIFPSTLSRQKCYIFKSI